MISSSQVPFIIICGNNPGLNSNKEYGLNITRYDINNTPNWTDVIKKHTTTATIKPFPSDNIKERNIILQE
jgi:hypothetical protein